MEKKLYFNVDVPQLIKEISNNNEVACLSVPLTILQKKLRKLTERAIELDDPELNIIMLEMKLYEVNHSRISALIKIQQERIDDDLNDNQILGQSTII